MKYLKIFLTLVMTFVIVFMFSSVFAVSNKGKLFSNVKCTNSQGHIPAGGWVNDYYGGHYKKCKYCEASYQTYSHDFGDYVITKKATCSEMGKKVKTCKTCGYQSSLAIQKDPSNHTGGTTTKTDARVYKKQKDLCYTQTVHTICKSCQKEISSTTNKITTHRMENGVCSVCGYTNVVSLQSVSLTYSKTTLKVGETAEANLSYNPKTATGTSIDHFESSNSGIVSVDSRGKITAKEVGTATITVIVNQGSVSQKGTCKITVIANTSGKFVPTLKANPTSFNIEEGKTAVSTITYNGDGKLTPSSNNSTVATASLNGTVLTITGKSKGDAKISISAPSTTKYDSATITIPVKVIDKTVQSSGVTGVAIYVPNKSLKVGEQTTAQATVLPTDISAAISFSSSDSSVASINQAGVIKALKPGTTYITASAGGKTSTQVTVTVNNDSISSSLKLGKNPVEIEVGAFMNVSVNYTGAGNLTASSSNSSIASIDNITKYNLRINGNKVGTTTVKVTDGILSQTVVVNVVEKKLAANTKTTTKINGATNGTKDIEVTEGATKTVDISVTPNTYNGNVKVSNTDGTIATVTLAKKSAGNYEVKIVGKKAGTSKVVVSANYTDAYTDAYYGINIIVKSSGNGSTPSTPGGGGRNDDDPVVTPTDPQVVNVDVIGRYNGNELAKLTENPTEVQINTPISIEGTTDSYTVTITSISAAWDDLSAENINGSTGTINVPESFEKGFEHVLHLTATASNNATANKDYIIKIPSAIEANAIYDGNTLENGESVMANPGDPMTIVGTPAEYVGSLVYMWDNLEPVVFTGSTTQINVPQNFGPGWHTLRIQARGTNGEESTVKYYNIYIPGSNAGDNNPLQVLPWENENHEMTQLGILLRNDSESAKANKNVYALGENVTYYLDFKNGGNDINDPVTLTLNVPLEFEIVDAGGGQANGQTITWEYTNGMKSGFSGTRTVVLKYKALSSSDIVAEKIYPLATISAYGEVKDKSAVINLIYIDSGTLITNVYDDATGTLIAIHAPYMYGDANATTFRPDDTITRAEGALVLVRILFGQDAINNAQITAQFPDLNETYLEAQKAISIANQYGIIIGYNDGTYKPNRTMTRAEFMKILATFLSKNSEENGIDGLQLKDMDKAVKVYKNPVTEYLVNGKVVTTHWALKEVSLLYRLNMTSLNGNELDLRMDKGITRAEVAQLVNFYLLRAPAEVNGVVSAGFSDVSMNHKLVADIIEATRAAHNFTITSNGKEYAN